MYPNRWISKILNRSDPRGHGFIQVSTVPSTCWNRPGRKDVELTADERDLGTTHIEGE